MPGEALVSYHAMVVLKLGRVAIFKGTNAQMEQLSSQMYNVANEIYKLHAREMTIAPLLPLVHLSLLLVITMLLESSLP